MPSEHDDARARQIEALRRYVAELDTQRERPTVELAKPDPASERPQWPSLPWLLVTVLLVTVALVGGMFVGAAAWSDDRPASPEVGGAVAASTTQSSGGGAGLVASPECTTAVDRANSVLAVAVRMRTALAQGTTVASGEPARFDRALAEYRQVVDRCTLRAP
jgi:hypothetical protein